MIDIDEHTIDHKSRNITNNTIFGRHTNTHKIKGRYLDEMKIATLCMHKIMGIESVLKQTIIYR